MEERLTYLGYVKIKTKAGKEFYKVSFYKIPDGIESNGYEALTIFPGDAMMEKIKPLKPMTEVIALIFFSRGKNGETYTNLGSLEVCK